MYAKHVSDHVTLNNGIQMPWLGLGVWQGKPKDGEEVENAILEALKAGYRLIDTASGYENEVGVGNAVRNSGFRREDIFVTTKVRNGDQGYDSTLKAFEGSLSKLNLGYIDLYLIHWPVRGTFKDTWRAFERLYREGLVRVIGVSNFQTYHLDNLLTDAEFVPTVNQIELHPLLTQQPLLDYCKSKGIQLQAWSPLMQGHLDHPILKDLAAKYNRTPAQIVLRWDLQHGVTTIPKSITPSRILENAAIFDFELLEEDIKRLDSLNQNKRFGPDPDTF